MSDNEPQPLKGMSEEELVHAAKNISGEVHLFAQGYPFTGFGRFNDNGRPEFPPEHSIPTWDLFWDVRVFGVNREWHAWRDNAGHWKAWFRNTEDFVDLVERCYVLWGSGVDKEAEKDGWVCLTEANGARIWLEERFVANDALLRLKPVRLKVKHVVGYDHTGVAAVVDVMLCEILPGGK